MSFPSNANDFLLLILPQHHQPDSEPSFSWAMKMIFRT